MHMVTMAAHEGRVSELNHAVLWCNGIELVAELTLQVHVHVRVQLLCLWDGKTVTAIRGMGGANVVHLPHFCKEACQSFSTLFLPDSHLPCYVARVKHRVVQCPMPKQLKSELIGCAQRHIIRA